MAWSIVRRCSPAATSLQMDTIYHDFTRSKTNLTNFEFKKNLDTNKFFSTAVLSTFSSSFFSSLRIVGTKWDPTL